MAGRVAATALSRAGRLPGRSRQTGRGRGVDHGGRARRGGGASAERRHPGFRQNTGRGLPPLPAVDGRDARGKQGRPAGPAQEEDDRAARNRRRGARRGRPPASGRSPKVLTRPPAPGGEKGPDARRRPKAAGEAYSCTLNPAAEGANEAAGPLSPSGYATNGGMGGMSTCCVLTSRTPRTERATSTASSMAAVPSSVTSPALASTVIRYFRVSGLVASATWI